MPSKNRVFIVSQSGLRKVLIEGFVRPNHTPGNILLLIHLRNVYGSSLIFKYNGHIENEDDENSGTPSVFHCKDIELRNPPALERLQYRVPSYTSSK